MTARPAKETRENFESGKAGGWTAGAWGYAVRVYLHRSKLKLRYQRKDTKRSKVRTLFADDTPELRKKAAAIAVEFSEKLRAEKPTAAPTTPNAETLTVREACLLYMRRVPQWEDNLIGKTRAEIETWYAKLPEKVRAAATTPAVKSVWSDVYAFRRVWRYPRLAQDRRVLDLEPADASAYCSDYIAAGGSPRTCSADTDKLSCAIRYVITQHRRTVGLTLNPIDGRKVDRSKAVIPAFSPDEARRLRDAAPQMAARGQWQVFVAAAVASSGRRLGAILGLSAADHDLGKNEVTFRAGVAKGENYGRGDEMRPMTALHRTALEWAMRHQPNPHGDSAPLIWQTNDPTRSVPQSTIWKQLQTLHTAAKVPYLEGRSWHSFRRMMATLLADEIGDGPTAEFIGMTTETLRLYSYKQVQPETMRKAAAAADAALGGSVAE